jgi:hypothetical protein
LCPSGCRVIFAAHIKEAAMADPIKVEVFTDYV